MEIHVLTKIEAQVCVSMDRWCLSPRGGGWLQVCVADQMGQTRVFCTNTTRMSDTCQPKQPPAPRRSITLISQESAALRRPDVRQPSRFCHDSILRASRNSRSWLICDEAQFMKHNQDMDPSNPSDQDGPVSPAPSGVFLQCIQYTIMFQ